MEPVTLPPMPTTVTPERAPKTAAAIDAMLDEANPDYRTKFVCETYIVYRREGSPDECCIVQVSPQQRTGAPNDNQGSGGFVGSGGHNPADDTP